VRVMREDRDHWDLWLKAAGVAADAPLEGPLFSDSTYSLQAAARGEGVALARRSIVGEDLERGTLKKLFDVTLPSPERYFFVTTKELASAPKVKAFCDWVKKELG
jgi:DNA-binding transcriptional LysR family regulator